MKRSFTSLTDVTLITAVVQHGYGEVISESLLEVGIQGFTSHAAMGVGIRERLGALGVAVDAERDVVNVMVSSDEVDRLFERRFMYATPLMQAATYVPPSILSKYVGK
jgi:nitrogen regulatory protein P-II 1